MIPMKMEWVWNVLEAEVRQTMRKEGNGEVTEDVFIQARAQVKTMAARILAALQKEAFFTYEDYIEHKGKQKG